MIDHDGLEAAIPRSDDRIRAAVDRAVRLLGDQVEGVGQGATAEGDPCVQVMVAVRTPELDARIPETLEGVPVQVVETGPFAAH